MFLSYNLSNVQIRPQPATRLRGLSHRRRQKLARRIGHWLPNDLIEQRGAIDGHLSTKAGLTLKTRDLAVWCRALEVKNRAACDLLSR